MGSKMIAKRVQNLQNCIYIIYPKPGRPCPAEKNAQRTRESRTCCVRWAFVVSPNPHENRSRTDLCVASDIRITAEWPCDWFPPPDSAQCRGPVRGS